MSTVNFPFISSQWQSPTLKPPGSLGTANKVITTPNTYRCPINAANGPMSFTILPDVNMIIGSLFTPDTQAIATPYGGPLNPIHPIIYFTSIIITDNTKPVTFTVWASYSIATRDTGLQTDWVHECGGWFKDSNGRRYAQLPRRRITWNFS